MSTPAVAKLPSGAEIVGSGAYQPPSANAGALPKGSVILPGSEDSGNSLNALLGPSIFGSAANILGNAGADITAARSVPVGFVQPALNVANKINSWATDIGLPQGKSLYQLMSGNPNPTKAQNVLPSALQPTAQESFEHPMAADVGQMLGSLLPYAASDTLLTKLIPGLGINADAPAWINLLKASARSGTSAAAVAPQGRQIQQGVVGASLPLVAYGAGKTLAGIANSIPKINSVARNFFGPGVINKAVESAQSVWNEIQHRISSLKDIATNNLVAANENQANQLGVGQNFEARLGTGIKNAFLKIRNSFKPMYESIRNRISGLNVSNPLAQTSSSLEDDGPNSGMTPGSPDISTDLSLLLPQSDTNEMQSALTSLKSTSQQIPAQHALDLWKALSSAARSARSRAQSALGDYNTQLTWNTKAQNLQKLADSYNSIMQNEFPSDVTNDLSTTNTAYKNQVIPFYEHGSFNKIMDEGKVPQNFMKVTSGNEPHQQIMQQTIQNDPELTRLAIGQKYAAKPAGLLQWDEIAQPYIDAHEPTQTLLDAQQTAKNNLDQANYMTQELSAQDKYQRASIVSHMLDQDHQNEMNEILQQKTSAQQKLDDLLQAQKTATHQRWALRGLVGVGALQYVAHRLGFDFIDRMF